MAHVFISYSRTDRAAVEALERALRSEGFPVWRDRHEIRTGDRFPDEIARAIDDSFAVAWLASPASAASEWVQRELAYASEAKKRILPIHLDAAVHARLPPALRLRFGDIHHVVLGEDGALASVFASLRGGQPQKAPALPALDGSSPFDAVEEPAGLDLLPIDKSSPLVIGAAIDVSGSMQTAIQNGQGQRTRLESVLDALRSLSQRWRSAAAPPDVAEGMGLAKLFAFGFGFADTAAKFGKLGALARRLHPGLPPIPAKVFSGPVRDLLELAGEEPRTLSLKDIDSRWPSIEARLWEQRIDLFGYTQMRAAMEAVAARFDAEFAPCGGTPHSALLLVSDGESKDGSPLDACRRIAGRGTLVLSCYLGGQDIAHPRRLYARSQPGWPVGAETLFRCSSRLEEGSLLLPALREKGWTASEGDRLFVQLNQSELVSEFASLILDLVSQRRSQEQESADCIR